VWSFCRPFPPGFEKFELGFFDEIVVLQDANHLEQIGFLIVPIALRFVNKVSQDRPEGQDRINSFGTQQGDALISGVGVRRQCGQDEDF
jgi:hypothetical protein